MINTIKFTLPEYKIPKNCYNVMADLASPPLGSDDLAPLFPMALIGQEVNLKRAIEIPQPLCDIYHQWHPTSLYRALRLKQTLDTPAYIYKKYEGVSTARSHKPNTAAAQAFYAYDFCDTCHLTPLV